MKRIISAVFVIIAATLAIVYFSSKTVNKSEKTSKQSIITSTSTNHGSTSSEQDVLGVEENSLISFMPLNPNETLLSSMGLALDQDTFDDEILVIRKAGMPNLYILVGLYNPNTTAYDRVAEIDTNVTQFKSFSYNGFDMTGDHRIALVYQGLTASGESVMRIYFCNRTGSAFQLQNIGDFKADGTIFIQQHDRDSSYELSQSSGRSFPVWIYNSDTREGTGSLSQVQTQYDWNPAVGRYVQVQQIFVTGKKIAAKELEKIQDGTVETFASHLDGLWYKTSGTDNGIRYIYFDYANSEVIFLVNETQEVYTWGNSNLYRNGIYLSITNAFIPNLRRRFDVSLTDIDEVRVFVHDDVRMRIGAENLWDGQYKKMNAERTNFSNNDTPSLTEDFVKRFGEVNIWYATDGTNIVLNNNNYSVSNETITEIGNYVLSEVGKKVVIQFSSSSKDRYLADTYEIKFEQIPVAPTRKTKNAKVSYKPNMNTIIMQPATIMSSDAYDISGQVLTLKAENNDSK